MSTAIVWFRNDLRLHDHEPLNKALEQHDVVVPFYCFDEKDFGKTSFGFEKTGSLRAQFLIESVQCLKEKLQELNSNLLVRTGNTAEELKKLAETVNAKAVYAYKDIHQEEQSIQTSIENVDELGMNYFFGSTLFHVNDLQHHFEDTPKVYTQFRKGVEKKSKVRPCFERPKKLPKLPSDIEVGNIPGLSEFGLQEMGQDQRAALIAKGGENEGLNRLNHYLFDSESLSEYKKTRNGLLGEDYSSKLSFWLWNGCVSPRKIYWKVKKYEKEVKKNQSTYWLIFELIWRDYFKFIALKHGNAIFKLDGIKKEQYEWSTDEKRFSKWANGETGIPFVDANMRELNETGFMSNRGRQNVASFLVTELGLDWRMGAEYFESKLMDYDVASNYGNWMYIAGVGNDPRDRYFNIISQSKRYDSKGEYVKQWLPELKDLDSSLVHHPWTAGNTIFGEHNLNYPKPMVQPDYWDKHYG